MQLFDKGQNYKIISPNFGNTNEKKISCKLVSILNIMYPAQANALTTHSPRKMDEVSLAPSAAKTIKQLAVRRRPDMDHAASYIAHPYRDMQINCQNRILSEGRGRVRTLKR